MRNSARKHAENRASKSKLGTLERNYKTLLDKGDKTTASKALIDLTSALDKAVKKGVVHRATVNRKKSRLSLRLNAVK
jgi:small subunit ribosomal protein S20